jgi:hypothetical protein
VEIKERTIGLDVVVRFIIFSVISYTMTFNLDTGAVTLWCLRNLWSLWSLRAFHGTILGATIGLAHPVVKVAVSLLPLFLGLGLKVGFDDLGSGGFIGCRPLLLCLHYWLLHLYYRL